MAKQLTKGALILLSLLSVLCASIWYANASAEKEAWNFCERMPLGSDIHSEIEKFEKDIGYHKVPGGRVSASHYGFPEAGFANNKHTFIFKGFMLDKAYCDVSLTDDGKIIGKNSFIQYD
ncbi:hypothetical protein [Massilia aquatica]|uniref:Uncharacterized protein n=1 Tax=Massilia aquatica TaxID=2609000 RepID=A0ABX0MBU7_9BURK|nr:hypothetical protein [Massilia aquatica]NHZ44669.1 hypothetical protein [Massilia aquatica]